MNPLQFITSRDGFKNAIEGCIGKFTSRSLRYQDCEEFSHAVYHKLSHVISMPKYSRYHPYGEPKHNVGPRIYGLFETIRQHIENASKNYKTSVEISVLKGRTSLEYKKSMYTRTEFPYTALFVPLPDEGSTQESFDKRGVLPCLIDKLALPVLRELLSPHGFKIELSGETVVQAIPEENLSNFIASGITVSWTKEINPFVIFAKASPVAAPKAISQTLWDAYKLESHTDITFVCRDKKEIRAHSLVLKLVSSHLEELLRHEFREKREGIVELLVSSVTLGAVLDHMYSGKNPFDSAEGKKLDAKELIDLANQWNLVTLREYAAAFIGQNCPEEDWKGLKALGIAYQSSYLLDLYKYYSLRFTKELDHDPEIETMLKRLQNTRIDPN